MSVGVSPTEKIRAEIDALFGGEREPGEVIEDVAPSAPGWPAI